MFSLTIGKIEHGWADIEMVVGGQPLSIVFEYTPNDALADFVRSARSLAHYADNTTVVFPNGPHRHSLSVEPVNSGNCKVSINGYSEGLSIKQYCREVLRMFDKYAHAGSEEKYHEGWRRQFPAQELEALRGLYRALKEKE